jgi:hypothetical protein
MRTVNVTTQKSQIMKKKIVYIAHPIKGNVTANVNSIIKIVRKINLEEPDVIPFAPYISDVLALNDDDPEERARGMSNGIELLGYDIVDELRVYGDLSEGVVNEIIAAHAAGIYVRFMAFEPSSQKLFSGENE